MTICTTNDGINLYYEDIGDGLPIIFIHEFAGDYRSWAPQVQHFSRNYRCITFNARGYPPSDAPRTSTMYSQNLARDDVKCIMEATKIEEAHLVGLSMGAFSALHFSLKY